MIWEAESRGDGLKRKTKEGIGEKLAEQVAMRQTVCDEIKKDIYTQVELFIQGKGFQWRCDTHLFMDGSIQRKMKHSWTKKVGTGITWPLCSRMRSRRNATTDHPACVRVRSR